jgi:hypothetical protein
MITHAATNISRAVIVAAGFVAAIVLPAQPAGADQVTELLNADRDICWQRSYSKAHLAKHPDQTVTFIRFAHLPSLAEGPDSVSSQSGRSFSPYADIEASFRGDDRLYGNGLVCSLDSATLRCGVECDGGAMQFRFKADGALLIDFRQTGSLVLESDCGEEGGMQMRELGNAADDKLFRLDPVDPAQCKGSIKARHDRWKAGG